MTRATLLLATLVAAAAAGCGDSHRGASGLAHAQAAPSTPAAAVARGKVEVPGGLLELMSPADAVVDSVAVAEGDEVRRGQTLVTLASAATRADLAIAQAELALAQAREKAQAQRLPAARQLVQRLDEAARAGATDAQRADEAQQALRDAESAGAISSAEVKVARGRLAAVEGQLERLTVTAPQDGTVVAIQAQRGARAAVQGPRPLVVLLPRRALLVRAEVNEAFAPVLKVGMRASVVPDGGPDGAVTPLAGRVARVSAMYGASRLDDESAVRANLRVVECWISLDQAPGLRAGQFVRVSLYE